MSGEVYICDVQFIINLDGRKLGYLWLSCGIIHLIILHWCVHPLRHCMVMIQFCGQCLWFHQTLHLLSRSCSLKGKNICQLWRSSWPSPGIAWKQCWLKPHWASVPSGQAGAVNVAAICSILINRQSAVSKPLPSSILACFPSLQRLVLLHIVWLYHQTVKIDPLCFPCFSA